MVSRNYTVQSDRKSEQHNKNSNNGFSNINKNNYPKRKENIYQKQNSVGTQYSAPQMNSSIEDEPKSTQYTYSTPTPKTKLEKHSIIPTYTSIVKQDLISNIDLKRITPINDNLSPSYTRTPCGQDSTSTAYDESTSHQMRTNCIDIPYQYSNNIGTFNTSTTETFSVQGYKIRIPLTNVQNNNNTTNNSLPTIAESIVDENEYAVDIQDYEYSTKEAKCVKNAAIKKRDSAIKDNNECYCREHTPYGMTRTERFQYISDNPHEMEDSQDGKNKYNYQGTHPDSLYRVAQLVGRDGLGGGRWTGRAARVKGSCRLLRWPLALVTVITALALLIYFLMPETTPLPTPSDGYNYTEWVTSQETEMSAKRRLPDTEPKDSVTGKNGNNINMVTSKPPSDTSSAKLPDSTVIEKDELNFGYADDDSGTDEGVESIIKLAPGSGIDPKILSKYHSTTASPPLFPTNLSPSVQYGNEHQDAESNEKRTPKKQTATFPVTDIYDNKFLTQTFAIFYNKGLESSTSSNESVEKDDDKFVEEGPEISKPNIDKGIQAIQHIPSFTSGHQNSFGIPIEEAVKIQSTTQSAVYNTRVSPTLPSMLGRNIVRSTTVRSRWNATEDGICFSTRLSMCRGVLPYDLTTQPLAGGARLLQSTPLLQLMLRSGCSPRARQFLCSLLEPECRPSGMKVLPPCRAACEEIASSCRDVIAATASELADVFECSQYPDVDGECAPHGLGSGSRISNTCSTGELRCPLDGSCVPAHWRCDNISDCPGGTDEQDCDLPGCGPNEFKCGEKGSCIPEEWMCDGHVDCTPNGEDERGCTGGEAEVTDVQGAASQHPRPARLPRPPRLQTTTQKDDATVTSRPTMEYENSKELLMMSDSMMPIIKPISSLSARKKLANVPSTTTRSIQVPNSASSSVNIRRISPCPIGDPTCKRRISTRIPPCIRGNCVDEKKVSTSTTTIGTPTTEAYNITQKIEEMEAVSGLTSHSSPCPQGELRCVDGRCITLEQLCDHQTDCSDGADEANCFA